MSNDNFSQHGSAFLHSDYFIPQTSYTCITCVKHGDAFSIIVELWNSNFVKECRNFRRMLDSANQV